ncbi:MAG: C25 family cysteine peptidase [Bacteroidales bacterium]|nr:C25 family cysteine peptidase [Bacteroidales bacterium]
MRKILLGVFIFLVGTTFAQDKRLSFSNGYVNSGKFKVTKSVTEGDSYIDVTYNFTGAYMYNQVENGKTYTRIEMPDARVLDIKGEPALPYYNDLLAITSEKNVSVSIVKSSYKEYSSNSVLPAVGPTVGNEIAGKVSESKVYSSNSFYPDIISKVENINEYRSVPFASVSVYPVRFNPATKKLRCYTSVTYRLKYNSSVKLQKLTSSKSSLEPLMDIVANPTTIEKLADASSSSLRASYNAYDYVIVTTPTFSEAAKKMSDWKTMIGYRCTTLVNSSWTAATIKSALRNIYATHLPDYLLIIGDHEQVPGTYVTVYHNRTDSYKTCSFYTDNIYACADDINYIEDVAKGRISATSNAQALTIVNKIINYEKNPTTASSFYNNVVLSAYFQDERSYDNEGKLVRDYDGKADLKFLNTSENIKSELINRNYNVNRIYTRTKSSSYYPDKDWNGNYLASDLRGNLSIWNGSANDISNAVKNGCALAVYNGHGNPSGWANIGFDVSSAQALTNGNKLPVFLGFCCQSGTFANSVCFTEAVTRNANGGGVGAMGYSSYGWTPTQDYMAEAVFNKLYVSKIRPMGKLLTQSLIQMGSSTSYHEHMHKVTHYFGDPSMSPWTDVPTCLTPTITKEGSSIRVKTGGVSGCKVTICRISDMTILSTSTMSGSEGLFNVGNAPCYVTITKHNYIPYVGVARDLYLQNMSFTEDRTIHGVNVTAGKNVTSDLTQGNVYVRSGKTTLLATSSLKLKTGFIVKSGAKFVGKKQSRPCNYSTSAPRSLRSADINLEYDDEEFEIDPEITDIDDAVSDVNGIEIYPNPTDGLLYIRSNNTINKVIVTDMTGKVILDEIGGSNEVEIDLSSNAQGMYLLNVVTDNDFYVEKVVLK